MYNIFKQIYNNFYIVWNYKNYCIIFIQIFSLSLRVDLCVYIFLTCAFYKFFKSSSSLKNKLHNYHSFFLIQYVLELSFQN